MIHQLKTSKQYFDDIAKGIKTFEVRKNDRNFQVGDFLALNELGAIESLGETGRSMLVEVVYILGHPSFCVNGQVIMSIRPCVIGKVGESISCQCVVPYSVPVYEPAETEAHP